ncbi:hypothetical protein ABKN59_006972 [Abortiporus biennis]
MSTSLFRFARFLRSIFLPTAAVIAFSCMLTFVFVLYQPTAGPGSVQRLGWQAWDSISDKVVAPSPNTPVGATEDTAQPPPSHSGVDCLPLDVWDPLMPHDTGFSEIAVTQCWMDPYFAKFANSDLCAPPSTKEEDSKKGKWVLVGRNINVQGFFYLNIYYRRTRRLDIPLITDIRILPEGLVPEGYDPSQQNNVWTKVAHSVSPRGEKLYIWYKAEKVLRDLTNAEKQTQLITEIDVTYGDDEAWYGFEKLERPVAPNDDAKKLLSVWLTIRRGVKLPPRAPALHFSRDGKFKILQIADLHYSVTQGECRDSVLKPCVGSDNLTDTLIGRVLDLEKPDLVVFTGDQLNGQGTSWDAKSVLSKFAKAVTLRQIPWAAVFGNHDSEDGESRTEQVRYMQGLPYSLVEPGPQDIHGVGNYLLKVYSADPSKTQLLTLYFLDSGDYEKSIWDFTGFGHSTEYDWIHEDQIQWFLEESARIKPIQRPFVPDGAADLGGIWARQGNQVTPDVRRLAKPNALMFFHIPLQEAYGPADRHKITNYPLDTGLKGLEPPGSAKKQDGFFDKALLKALETNNRGGGNAREVKVIANGHCHITENCRRTRGIWQCFGGGGSYSGYGRVGFDRRFRVFSIEDYGETISTWKRTEHMEIHDPMVLSGKGSPPPYEGP